MGILEKVKKPAAKSKKVAPVAAENKSEKSKVVLAEAGRVLKRAIVSEKSAIYEAHNVYTFEVDRKATKVDVKRAVEALYEVKPQKVRMINVEGKKVRFGRTLGRRSDFKKALVTLKKGKTISIHEGV